MISKKMLKNKSLNEQLALYLHDKSFKENNKLSEEDNFSLLCNNNGIIPIKYKLPKYWISRPIGLIIMKKKVGGKKYLFIPSAFARFKYYDPDKERFINVNILNCNDFDTENAVIVMEGFPNRPLTRKDVLLFSLKSWKVINYVSIVLIAVIVTALGYWLPVLNSMLFEKAIPGGPISSIFGIALGIIAFNVGKILFSTLHKVFVTFLSSRTDLRLRSAMMERIISLPNRVFNEMPASDITKRINYLKDIANDSVAAIFIYLLSALFSVTYFYQISKYGSMLVIPSLIIVLIITGFSIFIIVKQIDVTKKTMEAEVKSNDISVSNITGIQKLKISGAENRAYENWEKCFDKELEIKYNPPFIIKAQKPILNFLNGAACVAIYAMSVRNKMDAATYYAFQTSFGLVMSSFVSLNDLAKCFASLRSVFDMLKPLISIQPENNQNANEVNEFNGDVLIENVSFKYDDKSSYILKDFSLSIKRGEYIAIVGKTGCGKSTLIKLLLGFEKPSNGHIYFDKVDIETINKRSLRKHIGTVMQNDKLFVGSIFENLSICAPTLTEKQAWDIADIIDMKEDIEKMPMKMKTLISEGSGGVSGGQRQRLAIGRAIANNPKIVILDEATSALDNIAQNKICRSLDKFNCTRIVIAHRLSTIKNCDRIIVLKDGAIVEDGNYNSLIKQNGYFATLVEKQRLD